ncbi:MAG: hypothetical protein GWN31_10975 [Candidatus Thorarchaeota archaeon]|nr:hypothetical protein [Candidatus Thorarchaeota archaeon]NIW14431.1 hypothetical protein [Candidatus Thorarchaeota archaeon]NIW51946.1 hypothetical protein [Candidatus Korarchaeota archaeon]
MNGSYKVVVHNFNHREFIDTGFEVEIEYEGQLYTFAYDREVGAKQSVSVVTFWYDNDGLRIVESIQRKNASKKIWGVQTQTYTPVSMVMYSPNHWDGRGVGNKHYFFMLDGCKRDGSSRGFYNEYLSNDLAEHRKVFEILGSKMRTETEGEQLSGLGFSSTKRNHVYVRVTGSFTRTLKINF